MLRSQRRIRAAIINSRALDALESLRRPDGPGFEQEAHERLIPNHRRDRLRQLRLRNPVYWPAQLFPTVPILLLQDRADWRAPPAQP